MTGGRRPKPWPYGLRDSGDVVSTSNAASTRMGSKFIVLQDVASACQLLCGASFASRYSCTRPRSLAPCSDANLARKLARIYHGTWQAKVVAWCEGRSSVVRRSCVVPSAPACSGRRRREGGSLGRGRGRDTRWRDAGVPHPRRWRARARVRMRASCASRLPSACR